MKSLEGEINLILKEFGDMFKEAAKFFAAKYVNPKTGTDTLSDSELMRSMKIEVEDERLVISVADYYRWIESGRRVGAKGIPISVLVDWIKRKRIQPSGVSINQLAFMIQRSIKKTGISKRPFLTEAYNYASKEFDEKLNGVINAVLDDVLIRFTKNKII